MKSFLMTILFISLSASILAQTAEEKERFMQMAINEAIDAVENNSAPFGAVIVKDGKVIGRGYNTVALSHDPSAHGEMNAIRDACRNIASHDLSGCDMYTSADPCPMCYSTAYWANIKNIYYAVPIDQLKTVGIDGELFGEICKPYGDRKIYLDTLMSDKAYNVFVDWQKKINSDTK